MDPAETELDSQTLLEQGEELLDSSRRLLVSIDETLRRRGSPEEDSADS